jgi:hypothetical protein
MQYYTFELTDEAKELCVIITPSGKFNYNRVPMGVKQSPNFAQEVMEDVFGGMQDVEVYIDDIGIWGQSWEHHQAVVTKVLKRLKDNGFTVNPLKCEWAVKETDWLGYWLTPQGPKPWKKKVEAIVRMQPPENVKQTCLFIGAVSFYRDMFPRRSHLLSPLTNLTGKGNFIWNSTHQLAFDIMKAMVAQDCMLRYPDHNKLFHIYTDASDYQLGAVIVQEGIPVAYYSRKLTNTQKKYTTLEKELLSIFMVCKEFETMLLGADITIHTDHKNLTFTTTVNDCVIRQLNFVERFHPTYLHITGDNNFLADMFSRLNRLSDDVIAVNTPTKRESSVENYNFSFLIDDNELLECFLNLPDKNELPFALDLQRIAQGQQQDQELWQRRLAHPLSYPEQQFGDIRVLSYRPNATAQWKICIPTLQLADLVNRYHQALSHCGLHRLLKTISMHLHHPKLRAVALHAARSTIHRTLGTTPGGIVFHRDMFLNIPLLTGFALLQHRRQTVIDDNLCRANQLRRHHDYQPGDECLALDPTATSKLDTNFLIQAHVNGTVTIQRTAHITDRINIRQIRPYFCHP